ncbi:MAG: ROK family protein [Lachnospiraceae bacterium]
MKDKIRSKAGADDKKTSNKVRIAKFILHKKETSKQEITATLGISMPTVLQNIKELTQEGLVAEVGEYESTGGRKAKALSIVADVRYAIGIDITANHISYVLIDLKGNLCTHQRIRRAFVNSLDYYEELTTTLHAFIEETGIDREKLLGVGVALPGIIDKSLDMLVRSHILQLSNVSLKSIRQMIPYEVAFENDANSAALAELAGLRQNAVYLSLSNTVGGAIYMHDAIYPGDHFKSGEFGHVMIESKGRRCYCGKRGCADAYCAAGVLSTHTQGSLEEFFERLKARDEKLMKVWDEYLEYLAIVVTNTRMTFDCPIILGGYVGGHMDGYMPDLYRKVLNYNRFESDTEYLWQCRYQREASAVGIAMGFVESYFDHL